jgi:Na+-transporting NADH:ubiquinone oxidoreductase subunit A
MATTTTRKGLDIKLSGAARPAIDEAANAPTAAVYPGEFEGIKLRLSVQEGDTVSRGAELFVDKRDERLKYRSPAGGTIKSITRGHRRFVEEIAIDVSADEQIETFKSYDPGNIATIGREEMIAYLLETGYLAFIKQRPFSKIANPDVTPKSIFVNGMNTAPHQADCNVILKDEDLAFQAGLDALTVLTDGEVHLCIDADAKDSASALTDAKNVQLHTFGGPHPSGNTSVHIASLDPIKPGDVVWVVDARNLLLIGKLLLNGSLPQTRVISVAGESVNDDARKYYRVRVGSSLAGILAGQLADGEQRVISGDVLTGTTVAPDSSARFYDSGVTIIPEGRERFAMGWLEPGFTRLSFSHAYLSGWGIIDRDWNLTTNRNGDHRAMVLTGYYDKVMPLDIQVDFLVRACLAMDSDEAINLGILETDPEDFALCEYICPCKTAICAIIKAGLDQIEDEGF